MENLHDGIAKACLIDDFKVVVADAEALLLATANQGGDKVAALRTNIEHSLDVVKTSISQTQAELVARTRAAAKATDVYVHDNPWQAVGLAASVGLVLGWLAGRR